MAAELGSDMQEYATGVVSISGAIDTAAAAKWLDQNPIYQKYLLWYLMQSYRKRCSMLPSMFQDLLSHHPTSVWDFDDQITARLYGFHDAQDYYTHASSAPILHQIRVPTLLVYAEDDPMVPYGPYQNQLALFEKSEDLHLIVMKHGGHVGFMGPGFGQFYTHEMLWQFVERKSVIPWEIRTC